MSPQPNRLAKGGMIDRSKTVRFSFDGETLTGHHGDTLASALLANGIRLVGRSFKYHRPRGILTAGSEEPNALVELRNGARREPNTRATTIELWRGLAAASQNRWPSLKLDPLAANQMFSPILARASTTNTFPPAGRLLGEVTSRRSAALRGPARQARGPRPLREDQCVLRRVGDRWRSCRLVRGARRPRVPARVILCEEDFRPAGGCLSALRDRWPPCARLGETAETGSEPT
jgi:sarcosine oxidase subunit alpha